MEPNAVHEEETNASRPSGSIMQINAISVDLVFAREKCADIEHNFSIRGYVSEMRTKNPKACNPFSSDDFNGFEEQIPQNLETHQDSPPLLNDAEKVPDSCLVAVADSEIAVNLDNVVKEVEEIVVIQVTGKKKVVHEGIADDTDYVPPLLNEFEIAESSGLLPEKMKSTNDEERIAETVNPVQNNDEVFVPEPVDLVLEVEKPNNELYDSDWSDECDPSYKFPRRKIKKLRLLSDLLGDKSSIRTDHVREDNSTTGAETSRPHDQILVIDAVNRQMPSDAEPTAKRSVIPCSDSSLQRISNKMICLKRKIERNQSTAKKKRKSSKVLDSSFPLSITIRNDVSKRCTKSSNISFGSSSSAGEPKNSLEPQILDRCQHRLGSSQNQDIDDIEIDLVKKKKKEKKNIRFKEAFLRNKQALDPNERANQEPSKLVNEQLNHRDGKAVVVQGFSDDVPMEIVELMAKNQYERTLGNNASGSHLFPFKTFNNMKTFPEFQDFRNSGSHYNMDQVEHSLSLLDSLTERTGSQQGEVVGTSMLPRFGLGSVPESSSSSLKGKTISDIKVDELKKTHESRSLLIDPIGFELDQNLKGPIDPYSDEKIPALQLLSLMDDRSLCSKFNGGTSRIFENGFSNGSMFFGARNGEGCSKNLPFGSLSLESQMQERSREKTHIKNSSVQSFNPGKDKQYSDDSQRITDQENITSSRTLQPIGICSLNRNPADFSIPEAGNVFTINYKDILKSRKKVSNPGL